MARQVLPIVGAVIGAYFGGPQGAQIGYAIGSLVGNAVDPLIVDGPKIGDVGAQTSSEGVYQPIYFGTAQGAGNLICIGPNVIRRKKQEQGKGGGPITVTEELYKTFAIRIGVSWEDEAGIIGVTRIWENGKLVYDIRPNSTIIAESAEFAPKFRLYKGTADQLPDPALEAIYGVGNTPSYRGRAYIVFPLYNITTWKAIPQYQFEVATAGSSDSRKTVIAIRTRSIGTSTVGEELLSVTGEDWDGSWTSVSTAGQTDPTYLIATDRSVIAYDTTGAARYRFGFDGVWSSSTGATMGGSGGYRGGTFFVHPDYGGVVLIPGGTAGSSTEVKRSLDYGASMEDISGTPQVNAIEAWDAIAFGLDNDGHAWRSDEAGNTWTPLASHNFSGAAPIRAHCKSESAALFAGDNGSGGARIWEFSGLGGSEITAPTFPSGGGIARIVEGVVAGDRTRVCLSVNGEIAFRSEAMIAWDYSASTFGPVSVGSLWWNETYFILAVSSGGTSRIWTSTDADTWTLARTESFTGNIRDITSLYGDFEDVEGEPVALGDVISKIHSWCGSSEFDVTDLNGMIVRGFILAGSYTGKDSINALMNLWMIDSPEYERKIHYRRRGKNVVESFTFNDLIDDPEEATREQAIEYPKKLHLDYQNADVEYAPAKATSSRSSIDSRVIGEMNVQVPVVLTPTEAFQRANVLHKVSWADADGEVVFSVPDQYLGLVPGDCISLYLRESIRRLRIAKMEYAAGQIKLTCRGDRQSAYTSNVEGLSPPPPTPPPPSIVGSTLIIVGDWPALRDQDDVSTPVRYVAMGGALPAWFGALAEQSTDGGNNYTDMIGVSSASVMGTIQNTVYDAAPYFTDHFNTVTVQLDIADGSVELDSLTELQFLTEGGGFALVKNDGTFEIMQYREADDLGDGLYELSYLQRGRLDSETHEFGEGDRFVLLSSVYVVSAPSSQIGVDMYYRATSYGQTTEDGTVVNGEFEGNSQREWPVANILLERVGDTINGEIVPRHRFGTEINPIRSINWNNYEITFQDAIDQFETLTQISDNFSFDASTMTFPVTVTVYQVNRITGAGPGKSEVIE
jgi:hypothetical protein